MIVMKKDKREVYNLQSPLPFQDSRVYNKYLLIDNLIFAW